jgi:eukaryotic-like serine/threonine-protein kinase
MTPERWQQVKQIFNSAINYRPEERGLFISQACSGDDDLRSEVESLIASHERSGSFIDVPAFQAAASLLADENSELRPGQTIGTYEILSFISRGGMGEVYLSEDKRLGRKVALKLLPASFTKDDDRLRRFEQEARAASALNHPNIITIFEIRDLGSTHVIATEFVEGETLRHRLSRSGVSISEALDVAIQVADALAAAHKAGIIHRDIKPENIMLRPDGYVKVLDFGLAKLSEQASPAVAAEAPTIQVRTGSGIVIGTAGYMSPEQARGLGVDNRSDIFSLGAVIYEMIARRKPFDGDTPSDTLAAILKTEPPSLSRVAPGTPAELVRIVTKCLKKDREERYQVVKDLWLDLKALKQELEFQRKAGDAPAAVSTKEFAGETTAILAEAQPTSERSGSSSISESLSIEFKQHKFRATLAVVLVGLLLAASGFGVYKFLHTTDMGTDRFWTINLSRLTNSGNAIDATISPDGKYVVYVLSDRSRQSLWIRQVSTANDKLIVEPAPVGFFGLTFSPDGNDLYYVIKQNLDAGTLYRIPVLGGTPVKVSAKLDGPVSFSPDGKQFAFVRGNAPNPSSSALVIANIDGTNERQLAIKNFPERFAPIFFTGPSWSPDGKIIAATVSSIGGTSRVAGFAVADGKESNLAKQTWGFAARVEWLPDMSGLLAIAGENVAVAQVWLVNYPSGAARRVTNDLSTYRALGLTQDAKKLTTVQAQGLVNLWIAPEGDADKASRLPTGNVSFYSSAGNNITWTPDGRIVFVSNEGGGANIWISKPDGSERKQLTANDALNFTPVVSADGRYIVFSVFRDSKKNLWRMNLDGSNLIQLTSGIADSYPSLTPDGRWVVYTAPNGATPALWKVSIDGGTPVKVFDRLVTLGVVSPDGKYIAYSYPDSPDPLAPPNRLAVVSFADGKEIRNLNLPPTGTVLTIIEWSADSKSVLHTVTANNVTNIWSEPVDGGKGKQLTDFKEMLITSFGWSRDGKQLACTRGTLLRDAVLITDTK